MTDYRIWSDKTICFRSSVKSILFSSLLYIKWITKSQTTETRMSSTRRQDNQTLLPNTSTEMSESQEDDGEEEETYGEPIPDHCELITAFDATTSTLR